MGGSFKKILSKSPVQTVGMRLMQGDSLSNAIFKNAGTPAQRGLHQWIHKSYGNIMNPQSGSYSMPRSQFDTSGFMAQQQQMLQNMQAQQRAKLAELRTQSPTYPTTTASTIVPDTTTTSAATAPTIATLAQTKIGDTNIASDLPIDFTYKPPTKTPKVATANTFSLPDMSDIKFGGA